MKKGPFIFRPKWTTLGATIAVLCCGVWPRAARAATKWSHGTYVGVGSMQQPSSQYYLLIYGANAFIEHNPTKTGISITAVGRPAFASGNYEEQDYGGFVELHQTVATRGSFSLGAGFGGGQMRGYVKSTGEVEERSDYKMGGPSATIDLRYTAKKGSGFTAQLSHTLLPGLSTSAQTKAWVAWPWSIVMLGAGYRI